MPGDGSSIQCLTFQPIFPLLKFFIYEPYIQPGILVQWTSSFLTVYALLILQGISSATPWKWNSPVHSSLFLLECEVPELPEPDVCWTDTPQDPWDIMKCQWTSIFNHIKALKLLRQMTLCKKVSNLEYDYVQITGIIHKWCLIWRGGVWLLLWSVSVKGR